MTQSEQILNSVKNATDPAELALLDAAIGTGVEPRNRPLVLSLLTILAAAADLAGPIQDNAADAGCPVPEHVCTLIRSEMARIDLAITAAAKSARRQFEAV